MWCFRNSPTFQSASTSALEMASDKTPYAPLEECSPQLPGQSANPPPYGLIPGPNMYGGTPPGGLPFPPPTAFAPGAPSDFGGGNGGPSSSPYSSSFIPNYLPGRFVACYDTREWHFSRVNVIAVVFLVSLQMVVIITKRIRLRSMTTKTLVLDWTTRWSGETSFARYRVKCWNHLAMYGLGQRFSYTFFIAY